MQLNIKENIKPISDFRKSSAGILKKLKQDHQPIILTQRGRSVAVIMDVESYEKLEYEKALRTSYDRGLQDIKRGDVLTHEEFFKRFPNA